MRIFVEDKQVENGALRRWQLMYAEQQLFVRKGAYGIVAYHSRYILRLVPPGVYMLLIFSKMIRNSMYGYATHPAFKSAFKRILTQPPENADECFAQHILRGMLIAHIAADNAIKLGRIGIVQLPLRHALTRTTARKKAFQIGVRLKSRCRRCDIAIAGGRFQAVGFC